MPQAPEAGLHEARRWLREAQSVCVLTGAGMSAESGIATFRDAQSGLWSRFDPMQLASREGFRADPSLVWSWYAERREGVRRAEPNDGHRALAGFARRRPGCLSIVTQNVDDLHQRAGSEDVIRLHGDILQDRWFDGCTCRPPRATSEATPGSPPRCPGCGDAVRPGVVWFGEELPEAELLRAQRLAGGCSVMLVVGTSGAVYPAAGLARHARRGRARVIILNPEPSEIDDQAHLLLRGTAARMLPSLLDTD